MQSKNLFNIPELERMWFRTQPYECVHECFIESFIQLIQKHWIMQQRNVNILLNGSAVGLFRCILTEQKQKKKNLKNHCLLN